MNDLYFDGITNGDGNPVYDKKYLNSDGSLKSEYDNIHIHLNDVSPNYDPPKQWGIYKGTTECLVVKKQLVVQGEGKTIEIINTVTGNKKVDNNGGAYALNGNIKFTNVDSVYIASIGGNEFGNHSTALTASGANANIEISGKKVHLIGSIDIKNGKTQLLKLTYQEKNLSGTAAPLEKVKQIKWKFLLLTERRG